jgi:hypothetical protein
MWPEFIIRGSKSLNYIVQYVWYSMCQTTVFFNLDVTINKNVIRKFMNIYKKYKMNKVIRSVDNMYNHMTNKEAERYQLNLYIKIKEGRYL